MKNLKQKKKTRRKVSECYFFFTKLAVFWLSYSKIETKEKAYKTAMFVLVVAKTLAQNIGTSNSSSGKTAKSKTCILILRTKLIHGKA